MECPTCQFINQDAARFCGMCGTPLTLICPACQTHNPISYRFCMHCGSPIADKITSLVVTNTVNEYSEEDLHQYDVSPIHSILDGEKRVATIIMADVQNSTDLMEDIGTEVWVEVMNELFQILENEIYRYGGIVDQFRGDGLVAFFGTDTAHEDDPERAVLAALSMQRMTRPYADQLKEKLGVQLSLRVGINTGEVIVTSVGNQQTYSENTAMGGAIALASRMETAAEPGTVLVSHTVYKLVEKFFDWMPLGELVVKGISTPVKAYRPTAPNLSTENRQNLELSNVLVGKDYEFNVVQNCISDLLDGLGGIVLLVGDGGLGKSLLVSEVRRSFTRQQVLRTEAMQIESAMKRMHTPSDMKSADTRLLPLEIQGRSRSYKQSQPYTMWNDLLLNWVGLLQDESKEQTSERLKSKTRELWGDEWNDYYPYLGMLLSLPTPESQTQYIKNMDAESLRQRYFITVRSWLENIAQRTPLVVTFNDMHWADSTSLELLKYCLPLCDYVDILWILMTRSDRLSQMWDFRYYLETEYPHRLTLLQLSPLTAYQSEQYIQHLIGADCLPQASIKLLVEQAEGNPYYIQELIRTLITNGSIKQITAHDEYGNQVEKWEVVREITTLSVPDSLQSILTARIDRLSPKEQQVLQIAAVIGTTFWSTILFSICEQFPDLLIHLTSLQRAQLITERGHVPDLGVEYIFKSNLLRDVAYSMLLRSQRESYHLKIAEFMKQYISVNELTQQASQFCCFVAYHFHQANKPAEELIYILKDADNAASLYANTEAAELYSQALQLIDKLERDAIQDDEKRKYKEYRFTTLRNRRRTNFLLGDYTAMREDAAQLLPLAQELGNDTFVIDALLHQPGVDVFQTKETSDKGLLDAYRALELSRKIGDKHREMESLIAIVNMKLTLNDPEWQLLAEQALQISHSLNDVNYETRLLIGIGSVYAFGNQPERSQDYFDKAVNLTMNNVLDDKVIQMTLLNYLGLEFERKGDYYRLLTEFQLERLSVSREIGHRLLESQALLACGGIKAIYLGDYVAGLSDLEESRNFFQGTPDEIYALFYVTYIQIMQANYTDALETLQQIHIIGEPNQERDKASLELLWVLYYNHLGKRAATKSQTDDTIGYLVKALNYIQEMRQTTLKSAFVSRQYQMALECQAVIAYLGLAQITTQPDKRQMYLSSGLESAEKALEIYQDFGFSQIIECVSEEVFFRYSQALSAVGQQDLALRYLQRAYDEMMDKIDMIPADSHYRTTYLEQVPLHQEIRAAYAIRMEMFLHATES